LQLVDYDNPTDAQKALIAKAQIINKDAGTSPKIRFISSITDFGRMKLKPVVCNCRWPERRGGDRRS